MTTVSLVCHCKNGPTYDELIRCHHCGIQYHLKCVSLTRDEYNKIIEFYCEECENDHDKLTEWVGVEASGSQKLIKQKEYFEIETIVRHRYSDNGREFYIRWKNFGADSNTWEPEHHLDGGIDILQAYLRRKNLPLSKIQKLVGSTSRAFDKRNWITIDRIMLMVNQMSNNRSYKANIEITQWYGTPTKDLIMLYEYASHCYVILYIDKLKTGYIADGSNSFLTSEGTRAEIEAHTKLKLVGVKFDRQLRMDYCGSSAILIALDFKRHYRNKQIPSSLGAARSLRNLLAAKLHKYPSHALSDKPYYAHKAWQKCDDCGKSFKSSKRSKLMQHKRFCKSRLCQI